MKSKKMFSVLLAVAMSSSLAMPAFAVEEELVIPSENLPQQEMTETLIPQKEGEYTSGDYVYSLSGDEAVIERYKGIETEVKKFNHWQQRRNNWRLCLCKLRCN